jgi:hypothetical protein
MAKGIIGISRKDTGIGSSQRSNEMINPIAPTVTLRTTTGNVIVLGQSMVTMD